MRILHVISSLDPRAGGTTTALAGMAQAQKGAGIDVTVAATFTADFERDAVDRLRSQGVHVELIGPTRTPLRLHRDISPVLGKLTAMNDLVHVHAIWEEIQHRAARIAQALRKPYIMTPHGMLDPWSLRQSRLKKRLYLALRLRRNLQRASAIYYTTETERRLTEPLKLRPPAIVETLGLDLGEFDTLPAAGTFRTRFPALGPGPVILFLSRIHQKKGLDLLVPAFARIATKHTDATLVIAGPDSPENYQAVVQAMIRECALDNRVVFTGMLYGRERIEAMVDADLFVLPSYQENFGIVVIEAMAAGVPVIVSDQVNMCDDVVEGEVGAVVPTQVEPLARELDRWLADDAMRRRAAERCRPFVWDHYDWNRIGERWKDRYEQLALAPARVLTPQSSGRRGVGGPCR